MAQISKIYAVDTNTRRGVADSKRRSGFDVEGVDRRDLNEILFKASLDHIIGSSSQVTAVNATIYWNSANTEFRDQDEAIVTLLDGDRILWAGLDAITADIDISTIDDLVHSTDTGVTIAFGTQNVLLGSNQSGFLNCSGTGDLSATNSPEFVVNNNRTEKLTDFETSKDFVLNVASSTTGTSTASSIRLLDDNNNGFLINGLDEIFDIATDLNAGSKKASTWYQRWIACDFLGNIQRLYVPDLTGTTDSTTVGSLEDSTADFVTDAVQIGDIVFNMTDRTQTSVTAVTDLNTLELADDFFISGEDYKIRILSPQFDGSKTFKARIGADYNNSSSDFDDSTYAQIQGERNYSEAARDFTIAVATWTTTNSFATIKQVNDFTGKGTWMIDTTFAGTFTASASITPVFSGVLFKVLVACLVRSTAGAGAIDKAATGINNGNISITSSSTPSNVALHIISELSSKPTFHN